MVNGRFVVAVAAVVVVVGISAAFIREDTRRTDKEPVPMSDHTELGPSVVQVDDLAKAPENHQGEVLLRGVVSGVNEAESVFAVIDAREFEACGVLTCAAYVIPVVFSGELPKPKSSVEITGKVVRGEKGMAFEAKTVEVSQ